MGIMIFKMTAVVLLHVVLSLALYISFKQKDITTAGRWTIGIIYGFCAVLSNHFNVNFGHSLLNIRDLSPLTAGLFFDPVSGIIAGLIGGVERYIIGTYFGIGSYTRIACSISTILAGFFAAILHIHVFRQKKPSAFYAFFMGAVMEVFHMYMVFVTHPHDIRTALSVVRLNSGGMIFFTAFGLMLTSVVLQYYAGEWRNPFKRGLGDEVNVSQKFMWWMFVVTFEVLVVNFIFSFQLQTQKAMEDAEEILSEAAHDFTENYSQGTLFNSDEDISIHYHVGKDGFYYIVKDRQCYGNSDISSDEKETVIAISKEHKPGETFTTKLNDTDVVY